ncbi:MAG: hypothetical protein D6689_15865 [Deltaproteobacteria bacterium]|nr:MAG: hypothetical protein D6689_15865 [Deltaproteobacteria bacterium]
MSRINSDRRTIAPSCVAALVAVATALAACAGEITGGAGAGSDRADDVLVLEGGELATELATSPIREASAPFVRAGAIWEGDRPGAFEIAASPDGATWSDWRPLTVDHVELEATGGFVGQIEWDEPMNYFRLRAADGRADYLRLELFDWRLSEGVEGGIEGGGDDGERDGSGTSFAPGPGGVSVAPRSAWGARSHRCSARIGTVYRMAIHHTETPTDDSLSPEARLRNIQSYHMNVRGWCDIGYHYLMSRDGRLWQGRPDHLLGAHAGGANTGNIGIAAMGSHDATPITDRQVDSLAALVAALAREHGVPIDRSRIKGHRQYKSTSCPGNALYAQLDDIVARAASGDSNPPGDSGDPGGACDRGPFASDGPWSCDGLTGTTTNPEDVYFTTSFGCWVDEAGVAHGDAGDNCEPACPLSSIGCEGLDGPDCERKINWYAAGADRFGCGTKLRVTNPDNGRSAILMVIDRGPNCAVERTVDHWVLDVSSRASDYLFGGPTSATERADVIVDVAPAAAPVGPADAGVCTAEPGDGSPAEFVTVRGILYEGADTSRRISGATVTLGERSTRTDAAGEWSFADVPAGTFTVTASAPGYQTRSITRATYASETWASFGLSPIDATTGSAVLQGVVYYGGDSGNRIPGAAIELSTGQTATADDNGFYRIEDLRAGRVTITASAPGWTTASVTRDLADGETVWGSVQLERTGGGTSGDPAATSVCYGDGSVCLPLVRVDPYTYPSPLNANYREPTQYIDMDDPAVDVGARVAPNFKLGELCVRSKGRYQVMQPHAVAKLQAVRDAAGIPLVINSGFRSPPYNASVGGATRSRHMYGDAFDIMPGSIGQDRLMDICRSLGAGYVAKYTSGHVHCDWRNDAVDARFFGAAFAPETPAWSAADLTADIVARGDGSYEAPATGYDETEGDLTRDWTAYAVDGRVLATGSGPTFLPPPGTHTLRVDIGGIVEVERTIAARRE